MLLTEMLSISIRCASIVAIFSYVNGDKLRKFEISENVRLNNQPNASFSNCESDVKCVARCKAEAFCAYAQYSTQGRDCYLFSKHACGSTKLEASQQNVFTRAPVDITDDLVQNDAELILPAGVTQDEAYYTIDGDRGTETRYEFGSSWVMEFDGPRSITKVVVTYFCPYNMYLAVSMSGTRLADGPCTWMPHEYFVVMCEYLPATACGQIVTSIDITAVITSHGEIAADINEVQIYS